MGLLHLSMICRLVVRYWRALRPCLGSGVSPRVLGSSLRFLGRDPLVIFSCQGTGLCWSGLPTGMRCGWSG
jgi:hypothetical protein